MSERTLSAHMCVQKRRHTDKDLTHVRLAFRTFQKFYEINMHNAKTKQLKNKTEFKHQYHLALTCMLKPRIWHSHTI